MRDNIFFALSPCIFRSHVIQNVLMDTNVGTRLREMRLEQGLSIRELHRRSGVAIGTIRRIEAGTGQPFDYTLAALAAGLGKPRSVFAGAEEVAS